MSTEARVGALALAAVALFVAVVVFVTGPATREAGYTVRVIFPTAEGVFSGVPVTIAGVEVGRVGDVRLTPDNRAEVVLRIRSGVRIPEGSVFTVASTGLLGDRTISVLPGPAAAPTLPPDAVVEGKPGFSLETLYARFDQVAAQVSDLVASADRAVNNVNALLGDPALVASLRQSLANLEAATARLEAVMSGDVAASARNLRAMSASLVDAAASLDRFVSQITDDPTLLRQVRDTVASVQRTSRQVEAMAQSARTVINDDQARTVRETIAGAKEVVEQARALLGKVESTVNAVGAIRVPERLLRIEYEAWYGGGRVRSDVELFLTPEAATYWIVGVHDLGAANLITLQRGAWLSVTTSYRLGVIEGQLGAGFDYRLNPRWTVGADLYNPARPTVNLYARYMLDPNWTLTLNARDLIYSRVIGLGIRRRF